LTIEEKPARQEPKSGKHWILWTLLCIFIFGTIGFLIAIDSYYAPDIEKVAPQAAEK
jgi:preprotein translocase subunit Sss1